MDTMEKWERAKERERERRKREREERKREGNRRKRKREDEGKKVKEKFWEKKSERVTEEWRICDETRNHAKKRNWKIKNEIKKENR